MTIFIIVLIVVLVVLYFYNKTYLESFFITSKSPTSSNIANTNITNTNNQDNTSEPLSLLIFVSKSCKHCVNYNKYHHDDVVQLAKQKGIEVKRIYADEDPDNLFEKFKVLYVPTCIIMKGDKIYKNLGSNVNIQSIKTALEQN